MKLIKLSVVTIAIILTACGGGGGGEGNPGPGPAQPPVTLTGVLLDSPVINIDYASGTNLGVTNAQGEFQYVAGQLVTFSIGDLDFPSIPAGPVLTPLNLIGTLDTNDSSVLNMLRLLQTLDEDGDPSNGITINDAAKAVATQVDFTLSEGDFAASAAVTNLIFNGGQTTTVSGLVDSVTANTHFEQQLISNGIVFGTIEERDELIILQYLAENSLEAVRHESGLHYTLVEPGTGGFPTATSTVVVRYKGYLTDGTVFDETVGTATAEFPLANLIDGWEIGIPLMQAGGSIVLYLPSDLGYGSQGAGEIPGNAVLIFEIDLVSFQ